jgi:hypothetical protein
VSRVYDGAGVIRVYRVRYPVHMLYYVLCARGSGGGGWGGREAAVVVGLLYGLQPITHRNLGVGDITIRGLHDVKCLFKTQPLSKGIDRASPSTKT